MVEQSFFYELSPVPQSCSRAGPLVLSFMMTLVSHLPACLLLKSNMVGEKAQAATRVLCGHL